MTKLAETFIAPIYLAVIPPYLCAEFRSKSPKNRALRDTFEPYLTDRPQRGAIYALETTQAQLDFYADLAQSRPNARAAAAAAKKHGRKVRAFKIASKKPPCRFYVVDEIATLPLETKGT